MHAHPEEFHTLIPLAVINRAIYQAFKTSTTERQFKNRAQKTLTGVGAKISDMDTFVRIYWTEKKAEELECDNGIYRRRRIPLRPEMEDIPLTSSEKHLRPMLKRKPLKYQFSN